MLQQDLLKLIKEEQPITISDVREVLETQQGYDKGNFYRVLKKLRTKNIITENNKILSMVKEKKIVDENSIDDSNLFERDNDYNSENLSDTEKRLFDYLLEKSRKTIVEQFDQDNKEKLNNIIMTIQNAPGKRLEIYKNYLLSLSDGFKPTEDDAIRTFLHITDKEATRVDEEIHTMMKADKKKYYSNFLVKYNFNPPEITIREMKEYLNISDLEAEDILSELKN